LQKVITCAANPFSIDWCIQKQSDAALSVHRVRKEMEDLRSASLSTAIPKRKRQDGPTLSAVSPTGSSDQHLDLVMPSSSKSVETHGESKVLTETGEPDSNDNYTGSLDMSSSKDKQANAVSAGKAQALFPRDPKYTSTCSLISRTASTLTSSDPQPMFAAKISPSA
jgi:hypothetical protein